MGDGWVGAQVSMILVLCLWAWVLGFEMLAASILTLLSSLSENGDLAAALGTWKQGFLHSGGPTIEQLLPPAGMSTSMLASRLRFRQHE